MVEEGKAMDLLDSDLVKSILGVAPSEHICTLGADQLQIEWLPEGTAFQIDEYDGSESIITLSNLTLVA